ncbi:MAG: magnesium/cobalt transporter CorA [Thermostichus sp. DG02_5_bins_236]
MRDHAPISPPLLVPEDEEESYLDYYYDDPGDAPGTLDIDPDAPLPEILLIDYTPEHALCRPLTTLEECRDSLLSASVSWIDIRGLGSQAVMEQVGYMFGLHPLALEDVVNVPQRPKVEEYEEHLILICRLVQLNPDPEADDSLIYSQVSFVLGEHYLLSLQETPDFDLFEPIRERIRTQKGTIRRQGSDYLAYALLDTIIDGYFPIPEEFGERIEQLEAEVMASPTRRTLEKIQTLKRDLHSLRRAIWPHRDAINTLIRDGNPLIHRELRTYLRDCYDHSIQVLDIVETYRELTSSLMDVYLSAVSNRMNEVMKFLTVVSSVFIPLTFVAGVYGMNFNPERSPFNMPELDAYWGYPLCLLSMVCLGGLQIFWFWRKGWFENFSAPKRDPST